VSIWNLKAGGRHFTLAFVLLLIFAGTVLLALLATALSAQHWSQMPVETSLLGLSLGYFFGVEQTNSSSEDQTQVKGLGL
jgi:hypothetical protein